MCGVQLSFPAGAAVSSCSCPSWAPASGKSIPRLGTQQPLQMEALAEARPGGHCSALQAGCQGLRTRTASPFCTFLYSEQLNGSDMGT